MENDQLLDVEQPPIVPPPPRTDFLYRLWLKLGFARIKAMSWLGLWRARVRRARYFVARRKTNKAKFFASIAFFIFIVLVAGLVLSVGVFAYIAKDLPRPDRVVRKEGFATKIYDRNSQPLYDVFEGEKRIPVTLDQVPEHLRNATVAVEDKNFYKHKGFDPTGILRAAYNIVFRHKLQGGSTLTQQLVKNVLLTSQRTISRKIKEFILALEIETKYSKDQILQMYLNEAPYGGTAWGVEAAAETYFDKKVSELGLVESAIVAGLPQNPSRYSPFIGEKDTYVWRTQQVLRRMREDNYISPDQETSALSQLSDVKFASASSSFKAPHFVMYVKKLLEDKFGQQMVEGGGLRVYTTLDSNLQEKAQLAVTEEIKKVEPLHITNGAAVVIDPNTGEILAMVGSKNFSAKDYDGQVNVALSLRQPGSAIKPVTYVTALKKGYTASTMLMDTETVFPGEAGLPDYKPVNYDGKYHGPLQMRYSLGSSINITAVKTLALVGIKDVLTTAFDMGLTTLEPSPETLRRVGLSLTLGGGEVKLLDMVSAYSAFANAGTRIEPVAILRVTDSKDTVLFEDRFMKGRMVLTAQQAFLINDILSDNKARLLTFGENNALVIPDRMVAVKTGTTNDKRDNWTVGWTSQVVAGVWVGNNDNTPMKQVSSGISGAAPIWRRIIMAALSGKPGVTFATPPGIVTAEVDNVSGYRAHDGFPSRTEYFIEGTEPVSDDPIHVRLKLCRGQDKLATPARISEGDYEEKEYFVFKEGDPVSTDGTNRWQAGIDSWLAIQGDPRYHPPTEYCGSLFDMAVIIEEPADRSQVNSNEFTVKGKIIASDDITKVEISANGEVKKTLGNVKRFEERINLADGVYALKVRAGNGSGQSAEREIRIGVNRPWDWTPSPTPAPIPTLTPTPLPSATPTPTSG